MYKVTFGLFCAGLLSCGDATGGGTGGGNAIVNTTGSGGGNSTTAVSSGASAPPVGVCPIVTDPPSKFVLPQTCISAPQEDAAGGCCMSCPDPKNPLFSRVLVYSPSCGR